MSKLIPVRPEHYDELARFMADFPGDRRGKDFWRERLDFWWERNPAMDERQPRGWCLEDGGHIRGFVGNIPTRMMVAGRPTVVMNATGWKVDPDQRGQSLQLWFALLGAARRRLLFCTTPNDLALEILRGLKFQSTGMPQERSHLRLTYNAPLELRLGRNPLSRAAAGVLNLADRARRALKARPRELKVLSLERAGVEVDRLWARTAGVFRNTNIRDTAALNWFCFGHSRLQKLLLACFRGSEVVGLAVFRRVGRPGDQGLECLDLWHDPAEPRAIEALAWAALDQAGEQGLDLVILPHFSPALGGMISALGLGRVRRVDHRHLFWAGKDLAGEIKGPSTYLVGLQGDVGI